ncbi:MAG TPA: hypothetical protein VFE30_02890 [Anaeromyxobacteraceae bacterium]|jgi:hypothetical protein|nr:hypothetical protein [Anaeromyxobacteraceae bacterium]
MAVAVMLNNFFHDLSVAFFTCALLAEIALWRTAPGLAAGARPLLFALDRLALRIGAWAFAGVIGFGAVRTAAFTTYEWLPAAGRNQIPALVVKHVLLVALLVLPSAAAWRARRRGKAAVETA